MHNPLLPIRGESRNPKQRRAQPSLASPQFQSTHAEHTGRQVAVAQRPRSRLNPPRDAPSRDAALVRLRKSPAAGSAFLRPSQGSSAPTALHSRTHRPFPPRTLASLTADCVNSTTAYPPAPPDCWHWVKLYRHERHQQEKRLRRRLIIQRGRYWQGFSPVCTTDGNPEDLPASPMALPGGRWRYRSLP